MLLYVIYRSAVNTQQFPLFTVVWSRFLFEQPIYIYIYSIRMPRFSVFRVTILLNLAFPFGQVCAFRLKLYFITWIV